MRTSTRFLLTLAVFGLMAGSVGTVLAGGPDHGHGAAPEDKAAQRDAQKARVAEMREARQAALASFHENRTLAIAEFKAANEATRASFLENKTRVLEECAEARNATSGNETAKCVRDGLKPLIEEARAAHKEARETFLERMKAARDHSMASFGKAKAAAHARHAEAETSEENTETESAESEES